MTAPHFFLISSYDVLPKHYLHGICWQDEDLIIGDGGYEKYRFARKAQIDAGQDGSYIVVNASEQEAVIGTDFSGYCKLFLYRHGQRWALSNSLIDLARFAASKHWTVTIDENHLASFFIQGSFGNQLTSLHTSVKEIRLVPSTMEALIVRTPSGSRINLRETAAASVSLHKNCTYGNALRDYLRLWVRRMASLLQSDLAMTSDLTGGRDSRTVLSLMVAASQLIGKDSLQRVDFTSNPQAEPDFEIASRIAAEFGLRFMDRRQEKHPPVWLSLDEAYGKWKSLCLGVYSPIYFPHTRPTSTTIYFGGAGGESHRRFYTNESLDKLLAARKKFIPSLMHFEKLRQDVFDDIAFLSQGFEASLDPLILHYRHFRDRCHGGRTPQYTNFLAPLAGADLRRASSLCSPEQLDRSQVLADIMINANRALASMPYDSPKKSFDERHFAELVDAAEAIRSARTGGKIFAAEPAQDNPGDFTTSKALHLLREDFLSHYEEMRKTGYFPKEYLDKARSVVEFAVSNGRLSHAVDGCPVSHVILAGELSRLSGGMKRRLSPLQAIKAALTERMGRGA